MRIVYRDRALSDLESIHDYIAQDNPRAAGRVIQRIKQGLQRLRTFPYSARAGAKPGTRELTIHGLPYLVIYKVVEEGGESFVEIVAVYHTSRKRLPDDY